MKPLETASIVFASVLVAVVITLIILLYVPQHDVDYSVSTGNELQKRNNKSNSYTSAQLNQTLEYIVGLLNRHALEDWFVAYGTLLGLARNKSCIEGDDDIDILVEQRQKSRLVAALNSESVKIVKNRKHFLQVRPFPKGPPVDFYLASGSKTNNDYRDGHEQVVWTRVQPVRTMMWRNKKVNMPANWEQNLINYYGYEWRIPRKSKGVYPPKSRI